MMLTVSAETFKFISWLSMVLKAALTDSRSALKTLSKSGAFRVEQIPLVVGNSVKLALEKTFGTLTKLPIAKLDYPQEGSHALTKLREVKS